MTRSKQDECDACIRLNLIIKNELATPTERENARIELEQHNTAARDQRRAISSFSKEYINTLLLPVTALASVLPDHLDSDEIGELNKPTTGEVLFLAEDFGQGIALPYYGVNRPSCDYFNSNLMLNLYIMADVTRNEHNVFLYDERAMGKGKDALCSLRIAFHLKHRNWCLAEGVSLPRFFIGVYDNCVGQNKSNITLKFASFLTLSGFYERVLLIYFIPRHSHMVADRVVAWVKRSLGKENIFLPSDIIEKMNTVKGVKAEFIDHNQPGYFI
jgi:hypothetical protein